MSYYINIIMKEWNENMEHMKCKYMKEWNVDTEKMNGEINDDNAQEEDAMKILKRKAWERACSRWIKWKKQETANISKEEKKFIQKHMKLKSIE